MVHVEQTNPYGMAWLYDRTQVVPARLAREHLLRTRAPHSVFVGETAAELGFRNGLPPDIILAVRKAGLVHDYGHPPYGHAGEDALTALLEPYGARFDHGARVMELVERTGGPDLVLEILRRKRDQGYDLATLVHDWADDFCWVVDDLENGVRAGVLKVQDILGLQLGMVERARARVPQGPRNMWWYGVTHEMWEELVRAVTFIPNDADIPIPELSLNGEIVNGRLSMDVETEAEFGVLKQYLFERFYRNDAYVAFRGRVHAVYAELFGVLVADAGRERAVEVASFLAGLGEGEFEAEYQKQTGRKMPVLYDGTLKGGPHPGMWCVMESVW